jgi:threonine dehydratase
MSRALAAGEIAPFEDRGSIAEGLVGNLDPDSITFALAQRHVDEIVLVEEAEIRDAVRRLYDVAGVVAEPSGAVALAALATSRVLRGISRVACLVTGRNVSPAAHRRLITS